MASNIVSPKDSTKDEKAKTDEKVNIELPNKHLKKIQNENEELKDGLEKKGKLILKLELEKQLKESQLSILQNLSDSKLKEYVTLNDSRKVEIQNEIECKNRLKTARINRMASILEYSNEMTKLRRQVFSPSNLDDEKINEEIEYLMAFYDDLNEKNKLIQFETDYLSKQTESEIEANDIIDKMQLLIKQMKLETTEDHKLNEEMQLEIMMLEKRIQENTETK